jgi:Ni/Co efflux regulator RcnB
MRRTILTALFAAAVGAVPAQGQDLQDRVGRALEGFQGSDRQSSPSGSRDDDRRYRDDDRRSRDDDRRYRDDDRRYRDGDRRSRDDDRRYRDDDRRYRDGDRR